MASATPTGTNKASYTPTNTALESCPAVSSKSWLATSSPLPPTPNEQLCTCMDNASGCVVKDSVSSSDYADLFSTVCGMTSCDGILHNGTTGNYGAYSMCGAKEQLNFVLDKYWTEQGKKANACGFGGSATTTSTVKATGTCSALMKEAGTEGTGTVTSKPSATAAGSGSASGTAGVSAVGSAGSASSGRGSVMIVSVGGWQVGVYVVTGVVAGLGMVLL